MTIKPDNRALRVLLWFVILFVPGGFVLLAWIAAESVQRRYRADASAGEPQRADGSLPTVTGARAGEPAQAA